MSNDKTANEDVQAEIVDLKSAVQEVLGDLEAAETCETNKDLIANLESALKSLEAARKAIYGQLVDACQE